MKTKTLRWLAGLVVGIGAAACSFVSCSQGAVECQVGLYVPFAAVLTPKGPLPACAMAPGFVVPQGDLFGTEFYHPASADMKTYNDSIVTFAIQSQTMGKLQREYSDDTYSDGETLPFLDGVTGHAPYATGTFTASTPDSNDMCHVAMTQPALEDFTYQDGGALADAGVPALAPDTFQDQWNNLTFYVTAAVQGDQFTGDLTRTDNGCSVTYHAVGLWPAAQCDTLDFTGTADTNPNYGGILLDSNGNATPDVSLCSPCANPDAGIATGSGINPNFPTKCVALFGQDDPFGRGSAPYYCVLAGSGTATGSSELPQLNTDEPACAVAQ